ncbi:MAG TPA: efflux RND transporter periplasmic adaptor subunit [Kofleriaceae bacterium]
MRGTTVLLLVSLAACHKKSAEEATNKPPPPAPVKVTLATVDVVPTPETLTLTGMIAADQRAEVTADTQGKVLAVMVERGQRVRMGDPVVRLDVRSAALSAREAQANVAAARAQKGLADEECRRTKALLDKGAITRSEYDQQTTQCASAQESVAAAQARSEMMSKSVADGLVRAPFDGLVAEKSVQPGEWVAPGRSLFTLVDDEPLKIELSVPEVAVQAIQQGQAVQIHATAVPCVSFNAKVTRIGAEIGRTRALIVEATIDKGTQSAIDSAECAAVIKERQIDVTKTALVPGMFAEAIVQVGTKDRAVVPRDAIAMRGKTEHVFVAVADGSLEDRVVLSGPSGGPGTAAIIKGDLKKGDKIVAVAFRSVVDGVKFSEGGPKTKAEVPADQQDGAAGSAATPTPPAPAAPAAPTAPAAKPIPAPGATTGSKK